MGDVLRVICRGVEKVFKVDGWGDGYTAADSGSESGSASGDGTQLVARREGAGAAAVPDDASLFEVPSENIGVLLRTGDGATLWLRGWRAYAVVAATFPAGFATRTAITSEVVARTRATGDDVARVTREVGSVVDSYVEEIEESCDMAQARAHTGEREPHVLFWRHTCPTHRDGSVLYVCRAQVLACVFDEEYVRRFVAETSD
jgi:hypothetical protein